MFLRGGGGGEGRIPAFKNFEDIRRRTHHSSVVLAIRWYLKSAVRQLRASKLRVSGRVLRGGGGGDRRIPAFKNFENLRRRRHHSSVVLAIKCY